jgi:hypothetical protein
MGKLNYSKTSNNDCPQKLKINIEHWKKNKKTGNAKIWLPVTQVREIISS